MTLKRQPRHLITRRAPNVGEFYMNHRCEPTQRTNAFAKPWTNGEPAGFTQDRAMIIIQRANDELKELVPNGVVKIGNVPFGTDELPGFWWHTEPR